MNKFNEKWEPEGFDTPDVYAEPTDSATRPTDWPQVRINGEVLRPESEQPSGLTRLFTKFAAFFTPKTVNRDKSQS